MVLLTPPPVHAASRLDFQRRKFGSGATGVLATIGATGLLASVNATGVLATSGANATIGRETNQRVHGTAPCTSSHLT